MKTKFLALLLSVLMTLSLAACGGGNGGGALDAANNANAPATSDASAADELPTINWRMASTWGSGNVHFSVDKRFGEILNELTNGKFTVTNYSEGELFAANTVFDT